MPETQQGSKLPLRFDEKTMGDAERMADTLEGADPALSWATGYNQALDKTNAGDLAKALLVTMDALNECGDEYYEPQCKQAEAALKKAGVIA